jgi:hypothetical protein
MLKRKKVPSISLDQECNSQETQTKQEIDSKRTKRPGKITTTAAAKSRKMQK